MKYLVISIVAVTIMWSFLHSCQVVAEKVAAAQGIEAYQ